MLRRTLVLSIALWVLTTGVATASVVVLPAELQRGGPVQLTFRVANDRDTPLTKVEVSIPVDGVSVKALAGWDHTEEASTITWEGGSIAPGEYVDLDVAIASVPDDDQLELAVKQIYDDGRVAFARPVVPIADASHEHTSGRNGLAVLAIVLACAGIVMAAVALMTRRTNPKDGPDQAPLP